MTGQRDDDGNSGGADADLDPEPDEGEAPNGEPSDEAVVETAATAAEGLISSRLASSDVADLDVRVRFEEGILEVDVYVEPTDDADVDDGTVERVADDAALAARGAVDELFADE